MRALSSDVWIKTAVNIYFFSWRGPHKVRHLWVNWKGSKRPGRFCDLSWDSLHGTMPMSPNEDGTAVHTRGGGHSLISYRYVPPQRVGFLCRFGLKTGVDFAHFGLGIGYGFRGNYGSVWTYLSFQFQMNQKERVICEFQMDCWVTFLLAQRLRSGKSVPPILLLLLLAGAEVIGSCYLLSACRSEKSLQCILIFWTRKNVQN